MTGPTHQLVARASDEDYTARVALAYHIEPDLDDMQRLLDATLKVFMASFDRPPQAIELTTGRYNAADWEDE